LKTIKARFQDKIIDRRTVAWQTMDKIVGDAQTAIGNLWMWLADITYLDWKQYHGLQDMTNSIKQRIHDAAAGPHFDIIAEIQEDAEAQINVVAKEAAGKLTELKEIGREKILLGDSSTNFGAGWIPRGVKMAADEVVSKVSEIVHGSETPTGVVDHVMEGVLKATDVIAGVADDVLTKIGQVIYETPQGVVESIVSEASKAVVGEELPLQSEIVSSVEDILSSVTDAAADAASKVSEAVVGTPQRVGESIASKISEAVVGTSQGVVESVVSQASSVVESASSIASSIVEDLPAVSHIIDQAKSAEDSFASVANAALSSASSIASKVASLAGEEFAVVQEGAQIVFKAPEPGIVEKATDTAVSVADDVASKLSEAVYGTEPGLAEKATDAAASIAEQVASKVSKAAYGTEPGVVEEASSVASSIVSEASEAIIGQEPGTMKNIALAVESVLDEGTSRISEAVDSSSSVASSLASEATDAYVGE
jgi:hypothetical protein